MIGKEGKETARLFAFGIVFLSVFLLHTNEVIAHKQSAESPVHQHLAWEAFHIWPDDTSHEIYSYLNPPIPWDNCHEWKEQNGTHIIEGAWAEDYYDPGSQQYYTEWYNLQGLSNFHSHFWECDSDNEETSGLSFPAGFGPFWSALKKAKMYWYGGNETYPYIESQDGVPYTSYSNWIFPGLIQLYLNGEKGKSYFYIGRIAHLLSDMSVPAHVHDDPHGLDENLEDYVADHWNEFRQDIDSNGHVLTLKPTEYNNITDIFYNQAQLAQNFPSNNAPGNIANLPASLENGWEWNRNSDFIDIPYNDPWPVAQDDGWVGDEANLKLMADCLLPLNMMYVANLYKLFWDTVHPFPTKVQVVTNISGDVTLTWENPQNENSVPTASYTIYYGTISGQLTEAIDNITEVSFTFNNLNIGTRYFFSVCAQDADGIGSNKTEEVTIVAGSGLDDGPWPMFRHNMRHTGQSIYEAFEYPFLRWKFQTGRAITSSPVIGSDGTIYVVSDGLYAIHPNGTLKWIYSSSPLISAPAIGSDGTIYFGFSTSLQALNPDGTLKWKFLPWMHVGQPSQTEIDGSPVVGPDGTIYVGANDMTIYGHHYVFAINPDGTVKWAYKTDYGIYNSSPSIVSNGTIYAASCNYYGSMNGSLYAINPDGTQKWKRSDIWYSAPHDSSPAVGPDGTIYIGSEDKYLYAVEPDGDRKWRYQTQVERWWPSYEKGGSVKSSPAISSDGTIYFGSEDNALYAVRPDGSLKWLRVTGGDVSSSPAIDSNGVVYVGSTDGNLYAVQPDNSLKWKYKTAGGIRSSPAIGSDGTVYVGSFDKFVYAIGFPEQGLYGKVTDMSTGTPVAAATVSAAGVDAQSTTDGSYAIALDTGSYNVVCSMTGYQTITIFDVTILRDGIIRLDLEIIAIGSLNMVTTELSPGETGFEYNDRVRISGGTYPYTYSIAYGMLPPGLSLDASYGNITGTPTSAGSYTFSVAVEDAESAYAEREFAIEVTEQLKIITELPIPHGTNGVSYFQSIVATGGTQPYTFTRISGTLPPGISFSSNGNVSGTPSSTGSYQFTVQITDASARIAEKTFNLEIVAPLVITTSQLNDGIVGEAYNQTLGVFGGYGTYCWSVYSGILPDGLSLNNTTGVVSGAPTEATYGVIVFSVSDEDGRIAYKDYTLQVTNSLQILTTTLPNGLRDAAYSEAIRLNGGIAPFTFSYTGQLPGGLTLDPNTGIISGIATIAGYTNVSITVADSTFSTPQTVTQNLGVRITSLLTVTTSAVLPNGKGGVEMNSIVLVAGGGPSPYVWSVVENTTYAEAAIEAQYGLPSGVTLNSQTGELSGTPESTGDFIFTIQVEDADHNITQKEFFWHISDDLVIVTDLVSDGIMGIAYSLTLEATGGLPHYTWRITSGSLPSGLALNQATGTIYGTPAAGEVHTFTIEVNDSDSPAQIAEKTFTMEVADELYISTKSIPNGRINGAYTATIDAQLGTPPYIWQLQSGDLPSGLELITSPSVATIQGTPTTAGTYVFTLEVSDSDTLAQTATQEYMLVICAGDFDYDGDVDGSDLAVFAADFGHTGCDTGDPCGGDFDEDGDVDGSDLAVFAADFGRTDCP